MTLSRQSLEILIDLIEIKINVLHIQDKDDARELNKLRKCRQELLLTHTPMSTKRSRRLLNPVESIEKTFKKTSSSRR